MIDAPNLVRDFGAVGDDNTLNDAAFAAFAVAVETVGVGFMPPGTFRLSGPGFRPSRGRIFGAGQLATRLRTVGDGGAAQCIAAIGTPGQGNSLVLEDFAILGPIGVSAGHPFTIGNNSRAILRRISVDYWPIGIWISSSWACILDELYLTNIKGSAISFNSDYSANGTSIRNCSIFNCGHVNNGAAIDIPNAQGCIEIVGNDIESCWGAMRLANVPSGKVNANWMERQSAFNIQTINCGAALDISGNTP